jgi:hypothetical protein
LPNDSQHKGTEYNDIQHNDSQHNDTQYNDIQNYDIQRDLIKHNDSQHKATRHKATQHKATRHNCLNLKNLQMNIAIKLIIPSVVSQSIYVYAEPFTRKIESIELYKFEFQISLTE